MAIQFTDFSRAPLIQNKSPFEDMFENVLKGYKMSQEPKKMKQEEKERELANQLKGLEVEHKPTEYALGDQEKTLANAMKQKAYDYYDEDRELKRRVQEANIQKALQSKGVGIEHANGELANFRNAFPNATPEEIQQEYIRIRDSKKEKNEASIERMQKLTKSQGERALSGPARKLNELREIQKGFSPGTHERLSPEEQTLAQSTILLSLKKDTSDPKIREKLTNANNMNITLNSIDPGKLTYYSGIYGQFLGKPIEAVKAGLGEGSQEYEDYLKEVTKANFASKQMRQYLGDSIQPSAQAKLDKLTKPEAWNVSPEVAEENFKFMRELYDIESQTLVRAMNDPNLFEGTGKSNNTLNNSAFKVNAPSIPKDVKTKEQFQAWMKTLNVNERAALKAKYGRKN